ncbi:hypothetical protein BH24ACT26_BH24ACT26_00730 [soil metagenome]
MVMDQALRATFRNFSTLFLLVAIVTIPLHLAHAFVFRDVIAVGDLHRDIESFPEGRQVQRVGLAELRAARLSFLALTLVELAAVPLFVRAARGAIAADESEVPTVTGAWRGALSRSTQRPARPAPARAGEGRLPMILAAAVLALAIGWLARAVGLVLIEPLDDLRSFAGVGLVEGACRALGGAFFIGPVAYPGPTAPTAGRAATDPRLAKDT